MGQKQYQIMVFEALINTEITISKLFKVYAKKFPAVKDFWTLMYLEEVERVNWLRFLSKKAGEGRDFIEEGRIDPTALEAVNVFLNEQILNMQENLIGALKTALAVEKLLLGKHYFEILPGDAEEVKMIFSMITRSIKLHIKKLEKAISLAKSDGRVS